MIAFKNILTAYLDPYYVMLKEIIFVIRNKHVIAPFSVPLLCPVHHAMGHPGLSFTAVS